MAHKEISFHEIKNIRPLDNSLKVNYIGKLYNIGFVEMHTHELSEVVYITQGSVVTSISGLDYSLKAGDFIVIPAGMPHKDSSDQGFWNLHLTVSKLYLPYPNPIVLHDSESRHVLTILEQLYFCYHAQCKNYPALINSLFDVLYQYILSLADNIEDNAYVAEVENTLILNLTNPYFDLKSYLDSLPFNSEYLRKLFLQKRGITPHAYLIQKRLHYAKQLLLLRETSNLSIQEISKMCGFSDPFYFSRIFKKNFGISPHQYTGKTEGLIEKGLHP